MADGQTLGSSKTESECVEIKERMEGAETQSRCTHKLTKTSRGVRERRDAKSSPSHKEECVFSLSQAYSSG